MFEANNFNTCIFAFRTATDSASCNNFLVYYSSKSPHVPSVFSCVAPCWALQKKQRECMELRLGVLRNELQRQRRALCRETDLRQKERAQLHKKGR